MANRKASLKDIRKIKRRTARNIIQKRNVKTLLKSARKTVNAQEAQTLLPRTMQALDKAAKTNTIHWRKAARLKSRLQRRINAL